METRPPLLQGSTLSNIAMAIYRSGEPLLPWEGVLISKFTPDGKKSTFASGLSSPSGLAVDGAGQSLCGGTKTATRSSNLAPMQPEHLRLPAQAF